MICLYSVLEVIRDLLCYLHIYSFLFIFGIMYIFLVYIVIMQSLVAVPLIYLSLNTIDLMYVLIGVFTVGQIKILALISMALYLFANGIINLLKQFLDE